MFKTEVVKLQDLYRICDAIVKSGQEYSVRKSNSRQRFPPLMYSYYDTEYLGGESIVKGYVRISFATENYVF